MRVGLSTPVVVQVPQVASVWEATATVEDLAAIAQVADETGFDFLTCSEHVAVPQADAARRGAVYWDPLSTLGFLAARTRRIRLATAVLVLPYHHPLELAKRYGTLDRLSGGRLVLGVGIGSLREEFDLIGAPWDNRGARADDAIRALRAAMGHAEPAYDGPYYSFSKTAVLPHAERTDVRIWVGGRTEASLRRAITLGDGWMPFGLKTFEIRALLAASEIPPGFEVVLSTGHAVDPIGDPTGTRTGLATLADAGATLVSCTISATSAAHYRDQVARLSEIAQTVDGKGDEA